MQALFRVVVCLYVCGGFCACNAATTTGAKSDTTETRQASPALQWKPGSHEARVLDNMQSFRIANGKEFYAFAQAFAASHGDVNHPALARMQGRLIKWFGLSDEDYAQLPVYMKTFSGTGPYRRLITKPGYSYTAGTVFLPCQATHLDSRFEVAFAYVGGWGVGTAGKAVDAGFQRSNLYDDYAAFINAQDFPQISKEPRFRCGHPIDFRFWAASDTELRFWAHGLTENGRVEAVEAHLKHPASYGWPASGGGPVGGIVLKRMTTIGQNDATHALANGVDWDADGSYFGIDSQGRPLIHWSHLVVGRVNMKGSPVDIVPWDAIRSDETLRPGMYNYPADPFVVEFTCTGCDNEIDAINLKKR
jgi:hypothetical protein